MKIDITTDATTKPTRVYRVEGSPFAPLKIRAVDESDAIRLFRDHYKTSDRIRHHKVTEVSQ